MAIVKKLLVAALALGILGYLFISSLEDTISEPYSLDGASLSGWTLEAGEPSMRGLSVLGLRPPLLFRANLFDQLFNRTMESMTGPPDDLVPIVLREEYQLGLAGLLSPSELLQRARTAGLDRLTLLPVCMAVKREPYQGTTRQFYFVLFETPEIQAFRAELTALAAERGASAGLLDPFEVVLPLAGSDPAFTTWWPLVVDRQNDCRAEIG